MEEADAYLVVYSVVDKSSFTRAEQILSYLQDKDLIRARPVILVANKIDLARSRAISAQGELVFENCSEISVQVTIYILILFALLRKESLNVCDRNCLDPDYAISFYHLTSLVLGTFFLLDVPKLIVPLYFLKLLTISS